ncbi:hypothetical protein AVEN_182932-1 [Araneus ventricosus]|uniref:Reverse transcriptase domain-containing protein n=1 Tax=Araneus ventricosus TaxID=182803 RepID=A0A4Y2PCL4_ARAVE|nr:hypothetical protein AVEN_182932-1 [Araneus ventricosus]
MNFLRQEVKGEEMVYLARTGFASHQSSRRKELHNDQVKQSESTTASALVTLQTPELIPDILDRFRMYPIGISADIEKAFLMLSVAPKDREFLRFFYPCNDVELIYRHCRIVFGVSSSPFLLNATIMHLLENCTEFYDVLQKLKCSFYVDKFSKWLNEMYLLKDVTLPRFMNFNETSELHVFVDACKGAYAACVFVRSEVEGESKVRLIRAKNRGAPLKSLSSPRLELMASCIGARLVNSVIKAIDATGIRLCAYMRIH